jgi:hypothetical protein
LRCFDKLQLLGCPDPAIGMGTSYLDFSSYFVLIWE